MATEIKNNVTRSEDDTEAENKRLIFNLCGQNFYEPDARFIPTKVAYYDDESCVEMFAKEDGRGKMYLIDNGVCVQSFGSGKLDVTNPYTRTVDNVV